MSEYENQALLTTPADKRGADARLDGQISSPERTRAAAVFLHRYKRGVSWFFWLAGLSIVNSLMAFGGGKTRFIFGLTITQLFDAFGMELAKRGLPAAIGAALALDLLAAGFFASLGVFAFRGRGWAAVAGLVAYALDALLTLAFGIWLNLAFHAFAFWQIWQGWLALGKFHAVMEEPDSQ